MNKYLITGLFIILSSACFLFPGETLAQSSPTIIKPTLEFRNDSLIIHYAFKDCQQDQRFRVWLNVTTVDGKRIIPKTLSGDVGQDISCGDGKEITWDMAADSLFLDDVIYVKVMAEVDVTVTEKKNGTAKYFFSSLLFPGSGLNLKKGNNKPYWLMGVVGYAGVATTLYYNQMKRNAYKDWETETDPTQKDKYYSDYEDNKKYMIIAASSTGAVWLVNLVWTLVAPESEPGTISLKNNRSLQFGSTVLKDNFAPGLALKYNF